jgi:hypothetical protein
MAPIAFPSDFTGLPGESLIRQGLKDMAAGRESPGALLIQIGAPRLRLLGISLPPHANNQGDADRRLYRLLAAEHGLEAHSQFNSLHPPVGELRTRPRKARLGAKALDCLRRDCLTREFRLVENSRGDFP